MVLRHPPVCGLNKPSSSGQSFHNDERSGVVLAGRRPCGSGEPEARAKRCGEPNL